jgi:hypothetical protein
LLNRGFRWAGQPLRFFSSASGFPVGQNVCAKFVQSHALGFVNLRHLRIVNHNLHHAETQGSDLPSDNVKPTGFPASTFIHITTEYVVIMSMIPILSILFLKKSSDAFPADETR